MHGQLCAQLRAERRKADVHAGEEQDKANIGIENADEDLGKAAARQAQQRDLKQEEDRHDRQHGDRHFLEIERNGGEERAADGSRAAERGRAEVGNGVAALIEKAKDQHREDRPDGAQCHKAEAVSLRAAVASDIRHAEAHGEDERHGHGAGRHAAGVKGDTEKIGV